MGRKETWKARIIPRSLPTEYGLAILDEALYRSRVPLELKCTIRQAPLSIKNMLEKTEYKGRVPPKPCYRLSEADCLFERDTVVVSAYLRARQSMYAEDGSGGSDVQVICIEV